MIELGLGPVGLNSTCWGSKGSRRHHVLTLAESLTIELLTLLLRSICSQAWASLVCPDVLVLFLSNDFVSRPGCASAGCGSRLHDEALTRGEWLLLDVLQVIDHVASLIE